MGMSGWRELSNTNMERNINHKQQVRRGLMPYIKGVILVAHIVSCQRVKIYLTTTTIFTVSNYDWC